MSEISGVQGALCPIGRGGGGGGERGVFNLIDADPGGMGLHAANSAMTMGLLSFFDVWN